MTETRRAAQPSAFPPRKIQKVYGLDERPLVFDQEPFRFLSLYRHYFFINMTHTEHKSGGVLKLCSQA